MAVPREALHAEHLLGRVRQRQPLADRRSVGGGDAGDGGADGRLLQQAGRGRRGGVAGEAVGALRRPRRPGEVLEHGEPQVDVLLRRRLVREHRGLRTPPQVVAEADEGVGARPEQRLERQALGRLHERCGQHDLREQSEHEREGAAAREAGEPRGCAPRPAVGTDDEQHRRGDRDEQPAVRAGAQRLAGHDREGEHDEHGRQGGAEADGDEVDEHRSRGRAGRDEQLDAGGRSGRHGVGVDLRGGVGERLVHREGGRRRRQHEQQALPGAVDRGREHRDRREAEDRRGRVRRPERPGARADRDRHRAEDDGERPPAGALHDRQEREGGDDHRDGARGGERSGALRHGTTPPPRAGAGRAR
ncbi:hypothetical protein QDR37_08560 [Amnibacterium sp. CER49]|uniref:hypothetical protein n=1 Tax=Amnibacterium sp. CER49 TaxID=3039161 RepID=UPI00244893BE|nr:hypothetical protein [Amnibacterium sp. CER49]MDH2443993.1 hypothetical protein [Amnibacterium sp. CER49]